MGSKRKRLVTLWDDKEIYLDSFMAHVPKGLSLDECWEWTGRTYTNGYTRYTRYLAHRVIFYFAHRRLPKGEIRHMCHNKLCVNPLHLNEGSRSDNMTDSCKVNLAPNQVLSYEDKVKIRELYATGRYGQIQLSKMFGVHQTTISRVVSPIYSGTRSYLGGSVNKGSGA